MTTPSYFLDSSNYTWKNALMWGICVAHSKRAWSDKGHWGNRLVHVILAGFEAIPLLGQVTSIFEKFIAALLNTPAERVKSKQQSSFTTFKHNPPNNTLNHAAEQEGIELESQNRQLSLEIEKIVSKTILPEAVDDPLILGDIYDWTPQKMVRILKGDEKAPTPCHLQAAKYIDSINRSQETRENEIIPFVYVGNYDALRAIDPSQGNNTLGFKRIISVTAQDPNTTNEFLKASIPSSINRIAVKVNDEDNAWMELESNFETLFRMIDDARRSKEPILIHCSQGQSRSVTVMMAYLINRLHINSYDALKFIKTKRFLAEPIPGLQARLIRYFQSLGSS